MKRVFECIDELVIGKILEVNAGSVRIELDNNLIDLTKSYEGRVYSIGQIGSIVKVHFGKRILFAYVRMLRMKSDVIEVSSDQHIKPTDDSRILEADLFCEGVWSKTNQQLTVNKGVSTYPLPMQKAYITIASELNELYLGAERVEDDLNPHVPIGKYVGGSILCKANVDKLFGHHCAILGSTGSGKSGTVASILHSVINLENEGENLIKPRIIMIDPHGEYGAAFRDKATIYQAYNELVTEGTTELSLPYWLLSGDELRSIIIGKTEHEATSQNNVIYKALKYARMAKAGIVTTYGEDPKGDEELIFKEGYTEQDEISFDRDKPYPFDLSEFEKHIDKVQGRKPNKVDNRSASDRKSIDSILDKLHVLRSDPRIAFLMKDYDEDTISVEKVMSQFFGSIADGEDKHLRIIDISGLPNEVAGVLTATIARLLFQYKLWENKEERKKNPILMVCEEAHRYVPNGGEAQYKEAQMAIRRIAKEGRKYGIGLMLVSQRPSEVESTVLSQCNSWIVLRLTNSNDKSYVANMLPDNVTGLTQLLSSFTRREALFVGEAAAFPARVKIRKLNQEELPDSSDISFIKGWNQEPSSESDIRVVMHRWMGTND